MTTEPDSTEPERPSDNAATPAPVRRQSVLEAQATQASPLRWLLIIIPVGVLVAAVAMLASRLPASLDRIALPDLPQLPNLEDVFGQSAPERPAPPPSETQWPSERAPPRETTLPRERVLDTDDLALRFLTADAIQGAIQFRVCSPCHDVGRGGPDRVGPNLWNVANRPKASKRSFNYSAALKDKGGIWSPMELAEFLHDPRTNTPGTKMAFAGISDTKKLANIIAYLETLSD